MCHGAESTGKDPRPEEKKMPRVKKTHIYIHIIYIYVYISHYLKVSRLLGDECKAPIVKTLSVLLPFPDTSTTVIMTSFK